VSPREKALKAWGRCWPGQPRLDEVDRLFRAGEYEAAEQLAEQISATQGESERLAERGEIPPTDYARIRMAMGAATYRGVWPVGIRR
jgi:hypothetical protein